MRRLAVVAVLSLAVLAVAGSVHATVPVYTVTQIGAGDGTCDDTCTLAEAIAAANTGGVPATIDFAVPSGPFVIGGVLPKATVPLIIDGTTQTGYSGTPIIKINTELQLGGGSSTVSGLSFSDLGSSPGLMLTGSGGDTVRANWFGENPDGTVGYFAEYAIWTTAPGETIGGTSASDANVFLDAQFSAIFLDNGSDGSVVYGNKIGTFADGTVATSGQENLGGVVIASNNNVIGGVNAGQANVIAAVDFPAVEVISNGGPYSGNTIRGNTFTSNKQRAIKLFTGANNDQSFPTLSTPTDRSVHATLSSTASTAFTIDFYAGPCHSSGDSDCQGAPIGTGVINTDGSGNGSTDFSVPNNVSTSLLVSATATDPNGNTSELSDPTTVLVPPPPTTADLKLTETTVPSTVKRGGTFSITWTVKNLGPDAAANASFDLTNGSGLTLKSVTCQSGWTCTQHTDGSGNDLHATVGSLPSGGTATFKTTDGVNGDAPDTTEMDYFVGSDANDPALGNDGDSKQITVTGPNTSAAVLSVTKTGPAKVLSGGLVTYKIVVKNNGPATANHVTLTDALPNNLTEEDCTTTGVWSCFGGADNTVGFDGPTNVLLGGRAQMNMSKGESATFTISARAGAAGPAQDTATAYADNATSVQAVLTTTILPGPPPLVVTKTPTDDSVVGGDVTSYTITIHNPRSVSARNVVVSDSGLAGGDPVLTGHTIVKGTVVGIFTDGIGSCSVAKATCTLDEIAPGTTVSVLVKVQSPKATGAMVDQANVTASDATFNAQSAQVLTPVTSGSSTTPPALDVTATPDQATLPAHATNAIRVDVQNPTADDASQVTVDVKNVKNGTVVGMSSSDGDPCQQAGTVWMCTTDSIGAGDTWHGTVEVQGKNAGPVAGQIDACSALDQTLCVSEPFQYTDTGPCVQPKHADDLCPDQPDAPLDVTKVPDNTSVPVGSIVNYTITVHNTRTTPANGVNLFDDPPTGGTVVGVTPADACKLTGKDPNSAAACSLGQIAAGATKTVVVRVKVLTAGSFANGVDVFSKADQTLEKKVTATAVTVAANGTPVGAPPPFDVTKDGPASAPVGSVVDYTVTVHNPRGVDTGRATVFEVAPAGTQIVGVSTDKGTCTHSANTFGCQVGNLAADETWTIVIHVKVTKAGSVSDTVDANTDDDHTFEAKKQATTTVTSDGVPVKPPPLDVTKTADQDSVTAGSVASYTVTVHNPRSLPTGQVVLTDTVAGGTAVGAQTTDGTYVPKNPLNVLFPSIPAGGTVTAKFYVKTTKAGTVSDTVDAFSLDDTTLEAKSNASTTVTAPSTPDQPDPPLGVTKDSNLASVAAGGIVTYTITVTNTRGVDLQDVAFGDDDLVGGTIVGIDLAADSVSQSASCDDHAVKIKGQCTISVLPAGASVTLKVHVRASGKKIVNAAYVMGLHDHTLDATVKATDVTVTPKRRP